MAARVFVITGPSGVGKGTLIRDLRRRVPGLELSVSATTRDPREGEESAVDYHFLSADEFAERADAGDFLEHATFSGNRYGTLRSEIERTLDAGEVGRSGDRGPGRPAGPCRDGGRSRPDLHRAPGSIGASGAALGSWHRLCRRDRAPSRDGEAGARGLTGVQARGRQRRISSVQRTNWKASCATSSRPD